MRLFTTLLIIGSLLAIGGDRPNVLPRAARVNFPPLLNAFDDVDAAERATVDLDGNAIPGVVLVAPDTCEVGELVKLDATASVVDGLTWQIIPDTPDFEVYDSGRRAHLSARVGGESFLIILAGAKDGVPFLYHKTIKVNGAPIPLTGLTAKVKRWLTLLPDGTNRDAKLLAMAGVFQKISEQEIDTTDILKTTALANSAVLGESLTTWKPFLDELGKYLDAKVVDGKLSTRDHYQTTWASIARAMERNAR